MGDRYTVVLPTNLKNNFDLLFENNIKFFNKNDIEEFIIICNDSNVKIIEDKIKDLDLNFKVLSEDLFLNESVRKSRGWIKQQIIKLSSSSIVKTKEYLVLDDDLFLVKELKYSDFFNGDKTIYSFEGWTDNSSNYSTNSRWWEGSCRMLQYDINRIKEGKYNMGVTPQLFKTELIKGLIENIKEVNNVEDWQKTFVDFEATEFSSYWIYLLKTNNDHYYTPRGSKIWDLDKEINILEHNITEEDFKQRISSAYRLKRNHFFVIQSYLNYPIKYYNNIVKSYMNIDVKVNHLMGIPSDINEHLQTLINYSKECSSIVELGTGQTLSTWAFLAARPKTFTTVDILHPKERGIDFDEIERAAKNENIDFTFILGDSRAVQFNEPDLLFIDTKHNYDILKEELRVHGNKSKKYIIFHDTISFGTKDEFGDGPGLNKAIKEFLKDNPHWKEKETWTHNNGLTVLVRS